MFYEIQHVEHTGRNPSDPQNMHDESLSVFPNDPEWQRGLADLLRSTSQRGREVYGFKLIVHTIPVEEWW